ncbi:MAG: hypothetical protein JST87_11170 [Bacteroidetes bacterium]|nr:hypothetical protein [Bacteroidota bacterium]
MKYFLLSAIALCILACHSSSSEKKFIFSPEQGKKYLVSVKKENKSSWFYQKPQQRSDSVQLDMQLELIQTKDSLYQLALTFINYQIKEQVFLTHINAKNNTLTIVKADTVFSNATGKDDIMHLNYYLLKQTKGLSLKVWMSIKGEVIKVDGFDEIADSITRSSGYDRKDVGYILKEYVGEKTMTDYLNELFCIAPDYYEKAGDSWVKNITLISKAPVKLSSMYKLESIHGDSLFLSQDAAISGRAAENAEPFMLGSRRGKLVVDRKTGIPYSYDAVNDTKTKTSSYIIEETQHFSATVKQ